MAIPLNELKQSDKPVKRKRCHICQSIEPSGADGKPVRYLRVAENVWECNYCNNQQMPLPNPPQNNGLWPNNIWAPNIWL
jgi:hypothetical protein